MSVEDGIYRAVFDSEDTVLGEGIVVVRKNKLHGGDSVCIYRGEYRPEDERLRVEVVRHKDEPTIFGDLSYYTFTLKCDENEDKLLFSGPVEQRPDRTITVELIWLGFLIG